MRVGRLRPGRTDPHVSSEDQGSGAGRGGERLDNGQDAEERAEPWGLLCLWTTKEPGSDTTTLGPEAALRAVAAGLPGL